MGLLKLPNEIFLMVLGLLDLEDQFNFSLSSRGFQFILRDEGICRLNLQKHASFSPEYRAAQTTHQYAKAWRQITKRKIAIQTANPFLVSIVAVADQFIYRNGALLYIAGREHLRVLLLQGSVTTELALDPQRLLQSIESLDPTWHDYRLSPLHYSCGVVSLLAQDRAAAGGDYLITLEIDQMRSRAYPLATTHRIFIRNDESHLYYGVRSYPTFQNPGSWTLRQINLGSGTEEIGSLDLPSLVGEEIGSNTSFEIFDGYFYGASSEQLFSAEPGTWNSFYYVFRFPIGRITSPTLLPKSLSWRRNPNEGSTDDRWASLGLFQDEKTGGIFICETRKEWNPNAAFSQRNCYRKEIDFPLEDCTGIEQLEDPPGDELDSPAYFETRPPGSVHNGDSGHRASTCTYMDSSIRSYNPTARSFVDLVNDPAPDSANTRRLRLRIRPMARISDLQPRSVTLTGGEVFMGDSDVKIWPPESPRGEPETQIQRAFSLINPQPSGRVKDWVADDRFVIYQMEESGSRSPSPIIIISFDPGLRFPGLPKALLSQESHGDHLQAVPDLPRVMEPGSVNLAEKVQPLYSFLQGENRPLLGLDLAL